MRKFSDLIVAVDIGTSRVCVVVGRLARTGVEIVGYADAPSEGINHGQIYRPDETARAVRAALDEASVVAGEDLSSIYVGISAGTSRGVNVRGRVRTRRGLVGPEDILAVREDAESKFQRQGRTLIHTLVRDYAIDEERGVTRPVGRRGRELRVRAHLVHATNATLTNLTEAAKRCDVHIEGVVLDTLASSFAVLDRSERNDGVVLVDIGGATTDLCAWYGGAVVHTAVIPFGGERLTDSIVRTHKTTRAAAEKLKETYGAALVDMVDINEMIRVPRRSGDPGDFTTRRRSSLATVMEPQLSEHFAQVANEVREAGLEGRLDRGYVLTGGSVAMPGLVELAESCLGAPVRKGFPTEVGGNRAAVAQPRFASAVGLLLFVARNRDSDVFYRPHGAGPVDRAWNTVRSVLARLV